MSKRENIKQLLINSFEHELDMHYRQMNRFSDSDIQLILDRTRKGGSLAEKAEKLIADFEKEFIQVEIGQLSKDIQKSTNTVLNSILKRIDNEGESKTSLLQEVLMIKKIINSTNLNSIVDDISNYELEHILLTKLEKELNLLAEEKASKYRFAYPVLSLCAIIIWAFLIKIFTWDIIEPFTWMAGLTIVFIANLSFVIWGKKMTPENILKNRIEQNRDRLYDLYSYSPQKRELLKNKIKIQRENHKIHSNNS